jgi:hypothetical protein
LLLQQTIKAPGAGSCEHEQQEDETNEDGEVTFVDHGIEADRGVNDPVRDRHFTGADKGDRPREQPRSEERSARCFDPTSKPNQGPRSRRASLGRRRKLQQLLQAVPQNSSAAMIRSTEIA